MSEDNLLLHLASLLHANALTLNSRAFPPTWRSVNTPITQTAVAQLYIYFKKAAYTFANSTVQKTSKMSVIIDTIYHEAARQCWT